MGGRSIAVSLTVFGVIGRQPEGLLPWSERLYWSQWEADWGLGVVKFCIILGTMVHALPVSKARIK